MKLQAKATSWLLTASAVVGLGFGCTTNPVDPSEDLANLTPEERAKIDADNQTQNARLDTAEEELEAIQATLDALYPVAAVDVKLSAATVQALFGDANPTRPSDTGRKDSSDYVSAEQALRLLAAGGGSSGGGGGGAAGGVTYDNTGSETGTQSFDAADTVEEALNALRWASQVRIDQTGTSWSGSNSNNVQMALAALDDLTTFPALGAGTNPATQPDDAFPPISQATDVKQALNALRFYNPTQIYGFIGGNALPNSYMTEAVQSLDKRTHEVELFIADLATGNTSIVNAVGVLYDKNGQPPFNGGLRKTSPDYNLPLDGTTLDSAVDELTLIIENYRHADNIALDFNRAPLATTRWAPGSTLRGGNFALAGGDTTHHLDALLAKINDELTDLDARVSAGGGGSSGGGPVSAANVTYNPATAGSQSFTAAGNVQDALGALRQASNIRFTVDTTLQAAGFPASSDFVQSAIASAYLLNKTAIDGLADNPSFYRNLTSNIVADSAASMTLRTFIQSVVGSSSGGGGGPSDADDVALGSAGAAYPGSMNVADALDVIDQRLDTVETTVEDIRDVTDPTFRSALRTFLLNDNMFLSGLVSTQIVQDAIDAAAGGGGGGTPTILGLSTNETAGRIQANGQNGILGAAEHCKATFGASAHPTAHMCTTSEVVAALGSTSTALLDSLSPSALPKGFWVWDNIRASSLGGAATARGGTHRLNNCGDFLYGSGDYADGVKGWIETFTPPAGTVITGYSPKFEQGAGYCNSGAARKILCCE